MGNGLQPVRRLFALLLLLGPGFAWAQTCGSSTDCLTPSQVLLNGSSSGQLLIQAPATGGGTATFFAGSDTVAGLAATQTFSNKTEASPTFTGTVTLPDSTTWTSTTITPNTALTALFASPPAIGGTSAAAITGSTLTSNGSVTLGAANAVIFTGRQQITSPAANQLQLGSANSSAPAAQAVFLASSGTGANTGGVTSTLVGSLSTGTGNSGDIILKTGTKSGSSGVSATTMTALTLKGETQESIFAAPARLKSYTVATLPAGNQGDIAFVTDALAPTFLGTLTGGSSTVTPVFYNGTAWVSF